MFFFLDKLNINPPLWTIVLSVSLLSFLITYFSVPVIVLISKYKNLYDFPNERKVHNKATPVLGGLAVFGGIVLSSVVFCPENGYRTLVYLFGGLITIMIIGLKDDILIINPKKKLTGQFLAAALIVILGDIRITDFQGIFGINTISYIPGIIFSVLLIVFFTVSFNFIDGIDGLAASFGCLGALFYGIWFMLSGNTIMSVLSFATLSALAAFIRFNVFSKDNKIFLGDAGAMITGLLSAVLTIEFIENQAVSPPELKIEWAPFLSVGLYFVVITDTLRVLFNRLIDKDLFKSAKNHIHHIVGDRGLSQNSTAIVLLALNILIFFSFYLLRNTGATMLLIYTVSLALVLIITVNYIRASNHKRNEGAREGTITGIKPG